MTTTRPREEAVQQELIGKFGFLADHVTIARPRRIYADMPVERFPEVFDYVFHKLQFDHLATITGQDEGENLTFMYHLAAKDGVVLTLKSIAPKAHPVIKSISSVAPCAICYEREVVDLLGAQVEGLPQGNRYPLPENWPAGQFPLRKDWKLSMLEQAD
jgi:membrane-bound hydrogenase subunit beta